MRIAQVAPLYESVPPRLYGGTERIVHYLTEELVRRGHEVTLYASGDSVTRARLRAIYPEALRLNPPTQDPIVYHVMQLGVVLAEAAEYDVIHAHTDFRALPLARFCPTPIISTNHNRLDSPESINLSRAYPDAFLTSLSQSHRRPLPWANFVGTIHNAVPVERFEFSHLSGQYLAFLGRLSPEKGPAEAIAVAKRAGIPLKIAAKINDSEREYYESVLRPQMDHPHIEFLGELNQQEKVRFLADACALLFPVNWPEPFGLAMIESMACGTPVLAFPHGAVPEVMSDGVTGYMCRDEDEMAARCIDVVELDRLACRNHVETNFSIERMADGYEEAYRRAIAQSRNSARRGHSIGRLAA
jgi:glycosyltransferase involved in cell wall biosynthesis